METKTIRTIGGGEPKKEDDDHVMRPRLFYAMSLPYTARLNRPTSHPAIKPVNERDWDGR